MSRVPLSKKAVELLYHPQHATQFANQVLTINFWEHQQNEKAPGQKEIVLGKGSEATTYTLSSISINLACANGKQHEPSKPNADSLHEK
jgi:hypothetical protein